MGDTECDQEIQKEKELGHFWCTVINSEQLNWLCWKIFRIKDCSIRVMDLRFFIVNVEDIPHKNAVNLRIFLENFKFDTEKDYRLYVYIFEIQIY